MTEPTLLEGIESPEDLRRLPRERVEQVAEEVRAEIIEYPCERSHLGHRPEGFVRLGCFGLHRSSSCRLVRRGGKPCTSRGILSRQACSLFDSKLTSEPGERRCEGRPPGNAANETGGRPRPKHTRGSPVERRGKGLHQTMSPPSGNGG